VLYKGRRHRVSIEAGKVQVEPLEQAIAMPLEWNMDAHFLTTPGGKSVISDVDLGDGSLVQLKKLPGEQPSAVRYAKCGSLLSPAWDWMTAASLRDLTVAAELNRGSVAATLETSNDGFRTVAAQGQLAIRDGVSTYPLSQLHRPSRAVRIRLDLTPGDRGTSTPVIDAFRITAEPAPEQR
jgi:hypothetical protein